MLLTVFKFNVLLNINFVMYQINTEAKANY